MDQSLSRSATLANKGIASAATLGRAARDSEVNFHEMESLRHRQEAAEVELEATRLGIALSDGYNNRPRSAEQAEQLEQQINESRRNSTNASGGSKF